MVLNFFCTEGGVALLHGGGCVFLAGGVLQC